MAKTTAKATRQRGTRTIRSRGLPPGGRLAAWARQPGWVLGAGIVVAALVVTAVVWAVGRAASSTGDATGGDAIDHVHGLSVNPANGQLYVAAHNGVFQLPGGGPARRVGDGHQDTMGFTITGADHFLASGHPAPGQGGPPHLGLIESTDAGLTWRSLSLQGAADFHALRYRHDTVYGYNSVTGQLLVSHDRTTWQTRSTLALRDLVVSPTSPNSLLATGQQGLLRSTDGGRTWAPVGSPAGGPALALLHWDSDERLWGVTAGGQVLRSTDGGTTWAGAGHLEGPASAFTAHGQDLYAAVHDGIVHSPDAGAIWQQIYP